MTRRRLRAAYTADELAKVYPKPHDSSHHVDHRLRVAVTIQVARSFADTYASAADLSCGDGLILSNVPAARKVFGDLAPGYPISGPLEETLDELDPVDLYVCTETIEHLDDPDTVLAKIRAKANRLVLSTPVDAWKDSNREHYWAWSREDVERMLIAAGFKPTLFVALDFRVAGSDYCFGIWGCR